MRVISKKTLREFWDVEPEAERPLRAWYAEAKKAEWKTPADVKAKYRNASVLKGGRIVFNIHGNLFRLVVKVQYDFGIVYIRFVGRHTDYDNIDAENI